MKRLKHNGLTHGSADGASLSSAELGVEAISVCWVLQAALLAVAVILQTSKTEAS